MVTCSVCSGTGISMRVHVPALSIKFKVEILWPCFWCKGKGVKPL